MEIDGRIRGSRSWFTDPCRGYGVGNLISLVGWDLDEWTTQEGHLWCYFRERV